MFTMDVKQKYNNNDDKHPKGDEGEMTEFGTCDEVEGLDQMRQMMAPG